MYEPTFVADGTNRAEPARGSSPPSSCLSVVDTKRSPDGRHLRGDTAAPEKYELMASPQAPSYSYDGSDHDDDDTASSRSPLVWKEKGNKAFEQSNHEAASEMYRHGIELCKLHHDDELLDQLLANRALCLLKLRRFDEAVEHCDFVLDRRKDDSSAATTKVLYRRALSRHGQATSRNCGNTTLHEKKKKVLLELARSDLLRARQKLSATQEGPTSAVMLGAVERSLQQTNSLLGGLCARQPKRPFPSPVEQRKIVLHLLRGQRDVRRNAAYFCLDWKWWCSWCHFVRLEAHSEIFQLLPTGARVPNETSNLATAPGPIDNSRLIFAESTCLAQWYARYDGHPRLRPNLVRGYHFEVLPREVYFALKVWFGEVSVSIQRRASAKIQLYPIGNSRPPPTSRCGACQSGFTKGRCNRCNVRYCDRTCQSSHWPYHRHVCGREGEQEQQPVGLSNLGNTCFVNAALQVLRHTTPLARYFLSFQYLRDLCKANRLGTRGKLARAFSDVLRDLWMSSAILVSPIAFSRVVNVCSLRFGGSLQHDSQEFLEFLLDGLHEDLRSTRLDPVMSLNGGANEDVTIEGAKVWDMHSTNNDSLVFKTFFGLFRSSCVCPDCNESSSSFESFSHVALQIPQLSQRANQPASERVTIERCLEDFLKPEYLDDRNLWYCSRCQTHVRATKTMQLWRLPNVLVVQLKRFKVKNTLRREKDHSLVDFPTECLDLGDFLPAVDENQACDSSVPPVYDLFGVINHYGRLGFGHYTAIARSWDESSLSPFWTLFDDSNARHIVESGDAFHQIVSPAAYVLLYRRRLFH